MRMKKGGFMRKGYAMGTDEDDIPEAEDIPMDEYMQLLKSLGAPVKGQESGIRSLESPIKKASMDENEERRIYEKRLCNGN